MHQSLQFDVIEATQVAAARRAVALLCAQLGFDQTAAGRAGIVVTELGSNLVKHALAGQLLARAIPFGDAWAVELLSLDKGPGIRDAAASMRDGFSTAGTPGTGLGAIRRQSSAFEIHSTASGTVLRAVVSPDSRSTAAQSTADSFDVGAVCRAYPGETLSGDAWRVHAAADSLLMLVADGLGHGPLAAQAAEAALAALDPSASNLEQMYRGIHAALRPTRGAAVGLARVTPQAVEFVGIGNVACRVRVRGSERQLLSHNGIAGHEARKVQVFSHPLSADSLVFMQSDGIATHWSLDAHPALEVRHPGLIAAMLYRDHFRGRDDATIVVARVNTAPGFAAGQAAR